MRTNAMKGCLVFLTLFIIGANTVKLYLNDKLYAIEEKGDWVEKCQLERKERFTSTNEEYDDYRAADAILPMVWLGNVCAATNITFLNANGITNVLSVAKQWRIKYNDDDEMEKGIKFVHLKDLRDSSRCDSFEKSGETFEKVSDIIYENVFKKEKTLIHSNAGISRSTSGLIKYMMDHEYEDYDFESALKYVKAKRSCVLPNPLYKNVLNGVRPVIPTEVPLILFEDMYCDGDFYILE